MQAKMARPGHFLLPCILALLSFLIICESSTVYLSSNYGDDNSPTCSECAPCKTIARALSSVNEANKIIVALQEGAYNVSAQNVSLRASTVAFVGFDGPFCNNTKLEASSNGITLLGSFNDTFLSNGVRLELRNLYWYGQEYKSDLSLLSEKISAIHLNQVTIIANLYLNIKSRSAQLGVSLQNTTLVGTLDLSASLVDAINIDIENSTFTRFIKVQGALSTAHVSNTRFSSEPVLFNNTKFNSYAVVNITSCDFINGSVLQVSWCNTTVRRSRFHHLESLSLRSLPEQSRTQANLTNSFIDARMNYWGHSSGPYSCCNPKSEGVFAILADTSTWCEDEACSAVHGNFDEKIDYSNGERFYPLVCQFDSYCPAQRMAIIGALFGLLAFACLCVLIFAIVSFYKYKTAVAEPTHPGSYSQSGFIMMSRQDPDALRNKTLLFMDVMSIFVAILILVAALLPLVILPQKRSTSVTQKTAGWIFVATACIIASRSLRIVSSLWHFFIIRLGRPAYRTLLGNAIFSSLIVQFTFSFRMYAFVNDLGATKDIMNYEPLPQLELPTGFLISYTTFFSLLWVLLMLSDLLLAVPLLWQTLRIIKKRDFAEVELLRRQLEYNPLGPVSSLLRAPRIRRSSIIISWITLLSGVLLSGFVIVIVVVAIKNFSDTGISTFANVISGYDFSRLVVQVLGRSNALISCSVILFLGFFVFRWRFYETALVWLYVALSIGAFFGALEMAVHFSLYGAQNADLRYRVSTAVLGTITLLCVFISTVLSIILVRRMKRELAPQIASSIYEQLEDTLTN